MFKFISDVISKFKFDLPANRAEIMRQLELDEDEDIVVQRKKNECIEIGEEKVCHRFFFQLQFQ